MKKYLAVLVGKRDGSWMLFDYEPRAERISNKPIDDFQTQEEARRYAEKNDIKIISVLVYRDACQRRR